MSEAAAIQPTDVTVVIPCLDEAGSLPGVLDRVPPGYTVIVVDNNSTDRSADVARAHGARVMRQPVPGYGSAVHTGILATTTPVVCVLDGDGSMDPAELPPMIADLAAGADLVVGRRIPQRGCRWPLHARWGNALVAARLRTKYRLPVHDIGAVRVTRTRSLIDLEVTDRRSGYPLELLVLAAKAGWTVTERDIAYRSRTAGRSKVSGSTLGTIRAIRDFWKVIG
ncbi:glycosyltransferase family 2 protein [Rhodococcus erythropolis]|uniref:glycosyltransferase family 2 protein n=1 Tax=Rhodococcus erythropolis TaxID=1833 RepID=UPI00294A1240|nr:glycosyltransferase family 2 protein [Rhodococcus erythropolis]MDV6278629.1 glycosyltransferase family 2 protein [Rhodococcus erythropolis]